MPRTAQPIKLRKTELRSLTTIIRRGTTTARTQTRARILARLQRGAHPEEIAATLQVSAQTVCNGKRRYLTGGRAAAMCAKARAGRPSEIDGAQRAKLTALACSTPPEGHARWSLRLLADKAVELEYCEHLAPNAVKEILKKTKSSRTAKRRGVSARATPPCSPRWSASCGATPCR